MTFLLWLFVLYVLSKCKFKLWLFVLWLSVLHSKYHGGSIYHTEGIQFSIRGFNIPWMIIDPGVNLPWGSKYHMTPVWGKFFYFFSSSIDNSTKFYFAPYVAFSQLLINAIAITNKAAVFSNTSTIFVSRQRFCQTFCQVRP